MTDHALSSLDRELDDLRTEAVLAEYELDLAPRRTLRRALVVTFVAFVAFMVIGNAAIAATSLWAQRNPRMAPVNLDGIRNGYEVNDRLWRGAAPNEAGYRSLAAAGVTTVVDLRGEKHLDVDEDLIREVGLARIHIPIRDGQRPSDAQLAKFLEVMADTSATKDGLVFVHCGAGVGRTGSMIGAYRASLGDSPKDILRDNLTAGPPSLEQLSYMTNSTVERAHNPNAALVVASRVLDAPRRIWSNLRH